MDVSGQEIFVHGNEFAQEREWDCDGMLDWELLRLPEHRVCRNRFVILISYIARPKACMAMNLVRKVLSGWTVMMPLSRFVVYLRHNTDKDQLAVVALNFAAVGRLGYRIGVPGPGVYKKVLNSDARCYGGSGLTNATRGDILAVSVFHMGQTYSLVVDLPPLAGVVLHPVSRIL